MVGVLPVTAERRRGGEIFVILAVLCVVVQVPGNTFLAVLLPPLTLLWNGFHLRRTPGEWTVWLWLLGTLVPAGIAMVAGDLLAERNYFVVTLAALLTALAVFHGGRPEQVGAGVIKGVYAGVMIQALIGVIEVATGFKLLFIRYPDASVYYWVQQDRFITTAMYPNYNDFSIALVLLALFIAARFVAKPASAGVQIARCVAVLALGAWIFHMGSRGALLGLIAGLGLLMLLAVRRRDIRALPAWFLTLLSCALIAAILVVSQSAYIQDGDTAARGRVVGRIWMLLSRDPFRALFGFGAPEELTRLSNQLFGGALVDPHNLLVETVVWGGIAGLFFYLLCWGYVVWNALMNRSGSSWYALGAVAATLIMPLLGVTPSVILHYVFPHYLMLGAIATMTLSRWVSSDVTDVARPGPQPSPPKPVRQNQQR